MSLNSSKIKIYYEQTSRLVNLLIVSGPLGMGGFAFILATFGVNFFSFITHMLLSRMLGPANFGLLNVILGISLLVTIPLTGIQMATTQSVIQQKINKTLYSAQIAAKRSFYFGLLIMVLLIASTPLVDSYVHVNSATTLVALAAWVPVAALGAFAQGVLLGNYQFRVAAFAIFIGTGVLRLVMSLLAVDAGFGVLGAMVAMFVAQTVSSLIMLILIRDSLLDNTNSNILHLKFKTTILSTASLLGLTALISVDTFFARHIFDPRTAGFYVTGEVGAHMVLYLTSAFASIMFPLVSSGKGNDESSERIFLQTVIVTGFCGITASAVMTLFPKLIILIVFGSKFYGVSRILGILSIASAVFAILYLFTYLHIARNSLFALLPWLGVAATLLFMKFMVLTITSLSILVLSISVITTMISSIPIIYNFLGNHAKLDAVNEF